LSLAFWHLRFTG